MSREDLEREKIARYLASRHGHIFNDDILEDWKEHYYKQADLILQTIRTELLGKMPKELTGKEKSEFNEPISESWVECHNKLLTEIRQIIEELR